MKRPHPTVARETDHVHLAVGARTGPLGRRAPQPALRDLGASPATREAQQGGSVAAVDQPEGFGLSQRAADHLRVRGRDHSLLFSRPQGPVREPGLRRVGYMATRYCTPFLSFSSQYVILISRYIVLAVVRCSCATSRWSVRR